jgi:heat shock protein HslJ
MRPPLPLAGTVLLLAMLAACQPEPPAAQPPVSQAPEPAPAPAATGRTGPPTLEEAANARYLGTDYSPFTLRSGRWRGEAVAGGASAPNAGLAGDLFLPGDMDGDGQDEAVVLLYTSGGGSGTFDYVALLARNDAGQVVNIGTAPLGDRVRIRDARLQAGTVTLNVVQAGPEDAACCPGQKFERQFALRDGQFAETETIDQGRQTIEDLAGFEWRLDEFRPGGPVPEDVEVTLIFGDSRVAGTSGCNRYTASIKTGETAGSLTIDGPIAGTRMACPPPGDEVEARFLKALESTTRYSFLLGRLALTWQTENTAGSLIFSAQPLPMALPAP